jgi:hypothetical protein
MARSIVSAAKLMAPATILTAYFGRRSLPRLIIEKPTKRFEKLMRSGPWRLSAAALVLLLASEWIALAGFPERPIRIVLGFGAGGPTDIVARTLADALSRDLGQRVVVENQPGASGNIATQTVARADADGYTYLVGANTACTVSAAAAAAFALAACFTSPGSIPSRSLLYASAAAKRAASSDGQPRLSFADSLLCGRR